MGNQIRASSSSSGPQNETRSEELKSWKSNPNSPEPKSENEPEKEPGAMYRHLSKVTEDTLLSGRGGRRAIEEAGFDPDLKAALLAKFSGVNLDSGKTADLSSAVSTMPRAANEGTRHAAMENAWNGEEETTDTILRMLDDAKKPLASKLRGKTSSPAPQPVDLRPALRPNVTPGGRVVIARERAAAYADMSQKYKAPENGLSEEEREAFRRELRERFSPGTRSLPNSLSGLAEMANQRIEDAIARGQFKNIPRGKAVERDPRADNPFIDTTEYIMNKMIQRQEIVPPWIEKQQELIRETTIFRTRLREGWKHHAARMISSCGGTLEEQVVKAKEFAKAEEVYNPRRQNTDPIFVPMSSASDAIIEGASAALGNSANSGDNDTTSEVAEADISTRPFRDPDWEATEHTYLELAVSRLNSMMRSYNLMAPELAKKPYFSLERELSSCFADVAPEIPNSIRDRNLVPANPSAHASDSLFGFIRMGSMSGGGETQASDLREPEIRDEKIKRYGFRQFWRDLWKSPA